MLKGKRKKIWQLEELFFIFYMTLTCLSFRTHCIKPVPSRSTRNMSVLPVGLKMAGCDFKLLQCSRLSLKFNVFRQCGSMPGI